LFFHVPFDKTVPAHVGADERSIDVDDLGGDDLRLETGLDRPLEDVAEPIGAPSLPDPCQAGVVGKRLMEGVADEPADSDIDVSFAQQLAVVHDPEQQPGKHQSYGNLGIDSWPAITMAIAIGDFLPQPRKIEHAVDPSQYVIVGDELAERASDE
jgi:hypothetical protein